MKMSILYFIGAVAPPSLIVLISLRSIPGYLALSGLLDKVQFFFERLVIARRIYASCSPE